MSTSTRMAAFLMTATMLGACSEPVTLFPQEAAAPAPQPDKISTESSANVELARFFCEDGVVRDSLLTFSELASETAQPSRIFFEDPARAGFLLTGIRNPMVIRSTEKTALVLFQASSLTGRVGERLKRQGLYLGEIDLVARVGRAKFLTDAAAMPSEATRMAGLAGIRLRAFGFAAPSAILPEAEGYRLITIDPAGGDSNPGLLDCPPSRCWNPQAAGSEIWFTSFSPETGKFVIRAFSRETLEEVSFPIISDSAQQFASEGTQDMWLEVSMQGAFLGLRTADDSAENAGSYLDLPPAVRGYLPATLRLANWNGNGETVVLATPSSQAHEQLWAVSLDRDSAHAVAQREIPTPSGTQFKQFVPASADVLFAIFSADRSNSPKLFRFNPKSQSWQALTRGLCENPSAIPFSVTQSL